MRDRAARNGEARPTQRAPSAAMLAASISHIHAVKQPERFARPGGRSTASHDRCGPGFAFLLPPSPGCHSGRRRHVGGYAPVRERSAERRWCGCEPHRWRAMTRHAGDACEASPRPSDVGALASRRSTAASSTHRARRLTPEASAPVLMPGGGIPRSPERGVVSPARRRRSPLRPGIPSGRRPHRAGMSAIIPMRGPLSRRKVPKIRNKISTARRAA